MEIKKKILNGCLCKVKFSNFPIKPLNHPMIPRILFFKDEINKKEFMEVKKLLQFYISNVFSFNTSNTV